MGAWGHGYREGDDYLDLAGDAIETAMQSARRTKHANRSVAACGLIYDFCSNRKLKDGVILFNYDRECIKLLERALKNKAEISTWDEPKKRYNAIKSLISKFKRLRRR